MGFLRSQKSCAIVIVFCMLNIITTTGTECKEYPVYPTNDLTMTQKWEYICYGLAGGFAFSFLIYLCFCSCTLFDDWLEKKIRRRRERLTAAAASAPGSIPNQTVATNPRQVSRQIPQAPMLPQTHVPIQRQSSVPIQRQSSVSRQPSSSVPPVPRSILRQPSSSSSASRQQQQQKTTLSEATPQREVRINLDLQANMS